MNHNPLRGESKPTKVTGSLGFGLLLVATLAAQASSQTILVDNFNDGVADGWTTMDATIGRSHGPAIFDASSGTYRFDGAGLVPARDFGPGSTRYAIWDESSHPVFSDGFVRATIRAETEGTDPSVLMRMSGSPETGLTAYMFLGTTHHGGRFYFNKIVNNRLELFRPLPRDLSFGVNEDWNIEAGAVGDQLSMKAWRVGDPEPALPQWTFTDRSFSRGAFGLEAAIDGQFPRPARVSASFDDVHFTFPSHDDPFTLAPYDIYLWQSPMPLPQVEGPFFVTGSPEKSDMRGDVITAADWPDLRISGRVTGVDGEPIPGLKLDFWQVDDQGSYDKSAGYDLRGHLFTDEEGNYELWTVMPANYESIRTRHLHAKIGGENKGFDSWAYTTQLYFPEPYDNDIDGDGTPDKVIEGGILTDHDAISLKEDPITARDLESIGAEFSDLTGNILTVNNNPPVDGYFDTTLNLVLPNVFQAPRFGDYNGNRQLDASDLDLQAAGIGINDAAFDLDGDGDADFDDRLTWVRDLKATWIGDSNLDGEFNSGDLIAVFQGGKYELDADAGWAEGDWNGDERFGSADLIAAFQDGGYELGARAAANTVPEPSGAILLAIGMIGLCLLSRRRS